MYRINKDEGHNQNITLTNIETKASIIIGKLTMPVMAVLEKEVVFDECEEHTIKLNDKWDFTISNEAGQELVRIASPIKKPIRHQQAKATSEQKIKRVQTKSGKEVIDIFDLIFNT